MISIIYIKWAWCMTSIMQHALFAPSLAAEVHVHHDQEINTLNGSEEIISKEEDALKR